MAQQISGESGVLKLARRQYTEALDALLRSGGYWRDAAYVAERVLTLDELKRFVDQRWPAQTRKEARDDSSEVGETGSSGWDTSTNERIRYLLARRLTRANRRSEARNYYPDKGRPAFDEFCAVLSDAERPELGNEKRAKAYFEAAKLTHALWMDGVEGVTPDSRVNARTNNVLAASDEEIQRALNQVPNPDQRTATTLAIKGAQHLRDAEMPELSNDERARTLFEAARLLRRFNHYASPTDVKPARAKEVLLEGYPSSILAWRAAQLMPNNSDATARVLCEGGSWIKVLDPQAADVFYKALVRRCRKTAIGAEADRLRWFPILDENGNLRVKTPPPSER